MAKKSSKPKGSSKPTPSVAPKPPVAQAPKPSAPVVNTIKPNNTVAQSLVQGVKNVGKTIVNSLPIVSAVNTASKLISKPKQSPFVATNPITSTTIKPVAPVSPTNSAIGVNQMKTKVNPVTLPKPKPNVTAASLAATIGSPAPIQTPQATPTQQITPSTPVATPTIDFGDKSTNDAFSAYQTAKNTMVTEDAALATAQQDTGVAEKLNKVNQLDNQLMVEQKRIKDRQEALYGTSGMTRAQAENQFQEENRQSLSSQADIALLKAVANNDYALADTIAKQKADIVVSGQKIKLDSLKEFFDYNKELMDSKTKQAYEEKIRKDAQAFQTSERVARQNFDRQVEREKAKAAQVKGMSYTGGNPVLMKIYGSSNSTKFPIEVERNAISKAFTGIDQLSDLSVLSKEVKTGLLRGKVNNFLAKAGLSPNAAAFQAQLTAITPNIARGTYGEVGVLTDNDVRLYQSTLPNLTSKEDQNKAIMAMTLRNVKYGLDNKLKSLASSYINVSGYDEQYKDATKKILSIEDDIGVGSKRVIQLVKDNPNLKAFVDDAKSKGFKPSDILMALGAQ